MPELPEVETIKNLLLTIVRDRTITGVEIRYARMIKSDIDQFSSTLIGKTILDVTRIGKFLIFHLTGDVILLCHLRMEGKFLELLPGENESKYARVIFSFADGRRLSYDDSRRFGIMKLSTENNYRNEEPMVNLGPEPFDIHNTATLFKRFQRSGKPIKQMLLDQNVMCGLGNIYADEVLFRCHLHPETPSKTLTKKQISHIVEQSVIVLNKAIEAGGSTIRTYHAAKGIDGTFQTELLAYGHEGKPCSICQTPMKKIQVGGRGSTFCPRCQRNSSLPLIVGITGKIASGKSTATEIFSKMGYETFSSDAIVHELYQQSDIQKQVADLFGKDILSNKGINRKILGLKVAAIPLLKKQLEKLIHPMVKKTLLDKIKQAKGKIVFIEVPLLYESKIDRICDFVIALDVNSKVQQRNLKIRHGNDVDLALAINANNLFESYKNKVDFLITNNDDIASLTKKLSNIIQKISR